MQVFTIDPQEPDEALVRTAAAILRNGGIIAYPTETFYGLGADSENEYAIEKIFAAKGRAFNKPLSLIIGQTSDIARFIKTIPDAGRKLMDTFWPGGLTLVFEASQNVSHRLTAETGKIGIRLSSNSIAAALAKMIGGAITATSANLAGKDECTTAREVTDALADRVDAVIDGGRTPGGEGSTIVDVTIDPPVVIREGIILSSAIFDTLEKI